MFVVLAGLPGSGKSRFRESYLAAREDQAEWAVLSTDDLIEAAAARAGATYDEVKRAEAKAADKGFRKALREALEEKRNILVDRTNLSARKRRALLLRASEGYRKICFWFDPPEAERRRRLEGRPGKTIPPWIDAEMRQLWRPPEPEEGFDEVVRVA